MIGLIGAGNMGSAILRGVIDARKRLSANLSWVNVLESMDFNLIRGIG